MKKKRAFYGFGTHRLKGPECIRAVTTALRSGYNLIDTAEKYYNSVEIGKAIKKSKRRRESFAIIHKLTDVLEFSRSKQETFEKVSTYLKELDTTYIDILLMHGPSPRYHEQPEIFKDGNIEVWNAMVDLRDLGLVKHIGVSNFNKEQMMYLIEATGSIPEFLEIQYNVLNFEEVKELKKWCDRMGIRIIGYSPLAEGKLLDIDKSEAYRNYVKDQEMMDVPEFALRFCLSHKVIPIPRSSNSKRIKQNLKYLKKGAL